MGSYNSAQVAVLIGIYILDMSGLIINLEQLGLHLDDRLIFIPDSKGLKT